MLQLVAVFGTCWDEEGECHDMALIGK